jgi:AcrR family transcriptional regulator
MRKAVLRTVMGEHLAVLRQREAELERILAGDSRLFAEGAGRFQEDLEHLRLVIRGFDELLPRAWRLEPGSAPRHDVNRVLEAKALVRARATAAVVAMTLQQADREHRDDDADRLRVATALFRYLRDQLDAIADSGSEVDEDRRAAIYRIAAIAGTPGFSGGGVGF